jgi:hypothetical protein
MQNSYTFTQLVSFQFRTGIPYYGGALSEPGFHTMGSSHMDTNFQKFGQHIHNYITIRPSWSSEDVAQTAESWYYP